MARFSKGDTGTVDLKTSPSALFNNLSCNGHYCTFVKGNNVYRFFEGATNGTMESSLTLSRESVNNVALVLRGKAANVYSVHLVQNRASILPFADCAPRGYIIYL